MLDETYSALDDLTALPGTVPRYDFQRG